MKRVSRRATYEVALAAICTGLILLFLWLSVLVRFGTVSFYIVCSGVLMVPLTKRYYWSSVFAYVAASLLAFAVVGDIFSILGFVAYFGPMTLLSVILHEKKVKIYIALPIKIVLINAVLAVFYFVTGTIFLDYAAMGLTIHYAWIAVLGTAILVALDFVLLYVYDMLKIRLKNVLRDGESDDKNDGNNGNNGGSGKNEVKGENGESIENNNGGNSNGNGENENTVGGKDGNDDFPDDSKDIFGE